VVRIRVPKDRASCPEGRSDGDRLALVPSAPFAKDYANKGFASSASGLSCASATRIILGCGAQETARLISPRKSPLPGPLTHSQW